MSKPFQEDGGEWGEQLGQDRGGGKQQEEEEEVGRCGFEGAGGEEGEPGQCWSHRSLESKP